MGFFKAVGWFGIVIGLGLNLGGAARSWAECGPAEDASRTSYRQLAWEDFQGARRFSDGPTEAATAAEIAVSVAIDDWQVRLASGVPRAAAARVGEPCVRAYMHKHRSGRVSQRGRHDLAHEQGHFDIAQLFAGILATRLERISVPIARETEAREALLREVRAVYHETMVEFQAMQARYEEETAFGAKHGRQVRWQRELAARLARAGVAAEGEQKIAATLAVE
jgi:hypothetical protein